MRSIDVVPPATGWLLTSGAMINGAHVILYSKDAEADRAFLRDVVGLPNVDVGGGWLIFGLPPSEVACHPAERGESHELYFLCEDVEAFTEQMKSRDVPVGEIEQQPWGRIVNITLPGGSQLGVYQPSHARPPNP